MVNLAFLKTVLDNHFSLLSQKYYVIFRNIILMFIL